MGDSMSLFIKYNGNMYEVTRRIYHDGSEDIEVLSELEVSDILQDYVERVAADKDYEKNIRVTFEDNK
jgi:hypothetical protein